MMTKKNLAKAVTLSVLLMLPYGMGGADDKYTEPQKTYNDSTNTYTYTLGDGAVLDLKTDKNENSHIGVYVNNENIVINGVLNIKMQKGEEQNSENVDYGILISGSNSLLDRRNGGNIEVIDGSSAVTLAGNNNKMFLGNSNITLTNTDSAYETAVLELNGGSGENNNLLVYGTGVLTNTGTVNNQNYKADINGVNFDINTNGNNNKIILGYQGNYNDSDFEKFNDVDNLKDIVKNLGSVEIKVTATNNNLNNTQGATATGININRPGGKTENNAYNIIAAGDVIITAEANSKSQSEYSLLAEANGINVISDVKNVTNIISVKSANITASATNTDAENAYIYAHGILGDAHYLKNANALIDIAQKSELKVTANCKDNSNIEVTGIYANTGTISGANLEKGGEAIVNTADIDITTNSTGGTVENVGIKTSGGNVTVNGAANISANASGAAEGSKVYGLWSTVGGNITINGTTTISTTGGQDIAIVAGTEGWNEESADFENPLGGTNNINLNYGAGSDIKGDIISGYGGNITIGNAETGISTLSARNRLI